MCFTTLLDNALSLLAAFKPIQVVLGGTENGIENFSNLYYSSQKWLKRATMQKMHIEMPWFYSIGFYFFSSLIWHRGH